MKTNDENDCDYYPYASKAMTQTIPKFELPKNFLPKEVVSQMIKDEMILDGNPRQNLASFVTTYMEPECEELMRDAGRKNFIDIDEYPITYTMQQRCVNMLARLYRAPLAEKETGVGTACIGSSEAIMLATLAMKWRWKEQRKSKGLSTDNPNIVFGGNVQVCWHKACKYFEIEAREAELSPTCLVLTPEKVGPLVDENTIGVCPILGSTFNGEYEDVKGIHDVVQKINEENGWAVPIHVDAASGGFVAPFVTPELEWDFRLPGVKSINVSGHKYGLVYAGIGWVLFREKVDLHPDLVFSVNYLGGDQESFTLNFSKSSANIVAQYYQFLRLGQAGYKKIMENCMKNAAFFREKLLATGKVIIVDKAHIPCVSWAFTEETQKSCSVFDLQDKLKNKGWIVPAYRCPKGAHELCIMRVVVKENFSCDLAEALMDDINECFHYFEHHPQSPLLSVEPDHHSHDHSPAKLWHTLQLGVSAVHRLKAKRTTGVC